MNNRMGDFTFVSSSSLSESSSKTSTNVYLFAFGVASTSVCFVFSEKIDLEERSFDNERSEMKLKLVNAILRTNAKQMKSAIFIFKCLNIRWLHAKVNIFWLLSLDFGKLTYLP